jgi:hypothetical protein
MASREGLCPCLSQTADSIVWCQMPAGHDGLHEWKDPVHPGHSKLWGGNVTDVVSDTRYRYESAESMRTRFGLRTNQHGGVEYMPMAREPVEAPQDGVLNGLLGDA